jgi:cellulose synthase operon protein C
MGDTAEKAGLPGAAPDPGRIGRSGKGSEVSHTGEDVRRLLQRCGDLPYGTSQMAMVDEAVRLADALGDRRLMFDARMFGSQAYTFGGEPAKAFVTFSWCLAEYDRSTMDFSA